MIHQIDLHGLSHGEAIRRTESNLIQISLDIYSSVEIITGKSKSMQDLIINEILVPQKFRYYIPPNNHGMIVVIPDDLRI